MGFNSAFKGLKMFVKSVFDTEDMSANYIYRRAIFFCRYVPIYFPPDHSEVH